MASPEALQTRSLSVCWQTPIARLTHYSLLTCFFAVAWPWAKQNEHSCGGLGSCPTPDCAFPQAKRDFEAGLLSALPKGGESHGEEQRSASAESRSPSVQVTFRKGLACWPHDWAEWLGQLLALQKRSDIMREPFCCISRVKSSAIYSHTLT